MFQYKASEDTFLSFGCQRMCFSLLCCVEYSYWKISFLPIVLWDTHSPRLSCKISFEKPGELEQHHLWFVCFPYYLDHLLFTFMLDNSALRHFRVNLVKLNLTGKRSTIEYLCVSIGLRSLLLTLWIYFHTLVTPNTSWIMVIWITSSLILL